MGKFPDIVRYRDLYHGLGSTRKEDQQEFYKLHLEITRLHRRANEHKAQVLEDIRLNQEEIDALRKFNNRHHSMWPDDNNREDQLNKQRNTLLTLYNNIEIAWSQSVRSAHKAVWEACQTLTQTSTFIAKAVNNSANDPTMGQGVDRQLQGGTGSLSYSQSSDLPLAPLMPRSMRSLPSLNTTPRDAHRRATKSSGRRRRSGRGSSTPAGSRLDTSTLTLMKEVNPPLQPVRQTHSTQGLFSITEDERKRTNMYEERMERIKDDNMEVKSRLTLPAHARLGRSPPPARVPSHAFARTPRVDAQQSSARIPAWQRQTELDKEELGSVRCEGQPTGNSGGGRTANSFTEVMRRLNNLSHEANHVKDQGAERPTTGAKPTGSTQLVVIEEPAERKTRFPIPANPYSTLQPNINGAAATQEPIDWNTRHQLLAAPYANYKTTVGGSFSAWDDDENML